jgi:hypothetical protein
MNGEMGRRARGAIGAVVYLLVATACAGENSTADDDGNSNGGSSSGAGGTSGTAGGGTGGSALPSKVGLNALLGNPDASASDVAGRSCPASTGIEWDVGAHVTQGGMIIDVDSPTPTDFGSTLEDGELDTEITCSVTATGGFEIAGGGVDPQITRPNGMIQFTFSGTAEPQANLEVALYTPVTLALQSEAGFPPCVVTDVHEHAPGALWADFECPALTTPGNPSVACRANGTVVVEYCATE